MKLLLLCALFFIFKTAASQTASIDAFYTSPETKSVIFAVKKELKITCNVTTSENADNIGVEWRKEGKLLSEVDNLKNRFTLLTQGSNHTLKVTETTNHDAGNWSCGVLVKGAVQDTENIFVATTIAVKIKTENINVVEEEKLRIECSVLGHPYPQLSWKIETGYYNGSVSTSDERITVEDYVDESGNTVEDGALLIEKVDKVDRGLYYCIAQNKYYSQDLGESTSMVRVKDKYAALWPFLGICAEVIVLCAVIIIYEKKRNKTELEESDTDQSPDQKNTPDHGKEANLRHRQ
ncbi:basigin [Sitophilus oryzae]|uniref:Basigin n=1 Tax=Sitophilus oryzae TaxID=7048 RepID=A0A6J2Y2D3_SITOR|nr:basigin [Sitophilus oryzae]